MLPLIAHRCGRGILVNSRSVGASYSLHTLQCGPTTCKELPKIVRETIFVIDLTPEERAQIIGALAGESFNLMTYDNAELFLDQVTEAMSGCVLVPHDLPGMGVRGVISEILLRHLSFATIVIGRKNDLAIAVELVRAGATDFLEHPFSKRQLRSSIRRALGR